MSNINPANITNFKPTDALFGRVRKALKSFDAAGLIDEGDFYWWVKEAMEDVGVSGYEEHQAVLEICKYKACLPENFSVLYSAYRCSGGNSSTSKTNGHEQTGFVFYEEKTFQPYVKNANCLAAKINFIEGQKVTVRTFFESDSTITNFENPRLMTLGKNVKGVCDANCKNLFAKSQDQFQIDKRNIYTNFEDGVVYIEYYGLALDPESGLPMIPDNTHLERYIESYIAYKLMYEFYMNGSVPDMDRRLQLAEKTYENALKQVMYLAKLPSFQTMITQIRLNRKNLGIYQQTANRF